MPGSSRYTILVVVLGLLLALATGPLRAQAISSEPIFEELDPSVGIPGEVGSILEKWKADSTTKESRLVALRPLPEVRALLQATTAEKKDTQVEFALSPDLRVYLAGEQFEATGEDSFQWFANLLDENKAPLFGSAIIGGESERLFGTVFLEGRQFDVHSVGSGFAIIREVDDEGFPPEHSPDYAPQRRTEQQDGPLDYPAPQQDEAQIARNYTITVLVPYTRAAETEIKAHGYANVSDFAQASINNANLIYRNSGVNVSLTKVKVYRLNDYAETGNWNNDINKFFAHSGMRQERDDRNADIAVLLFNDQSHCGEADKINATFNTAFAVVWWKCSIGSKSFAHEIAHLQGAEHDTENASNPPAFPYGHGFHHGRRWRTVMTYPDVCSRCPRLPYFSNPSIRHPTDRVPMGDASKRDNARVLRETANRISSFQ